MTYVYIAVAVVLILLAAVASYWLWRRRRLANSDSAVQVTPRRRWFWQRRGKLTERVRVWVKDQAGDRKIAAWFEELSESEAREIAQDLRRFSVNMGFDLDWVLREDKLPDDKLEKELRQVLVQRLKARYASDQVADNIVIYDQYLRLVGNPARHAKTIQSLYTELVSRELAPTTPPEMVMAPSAERRAFLIEKIQEAADKDWAEFAKAMEAVEAQENEAGEGRWHFSAPKLPNVPFLRRRTETNEAAQAPAETPTPTASTSGDQADKEPPAPSTPTPAPSPA
jgi:hypothetical protein